MPEILVHCARCGGVSPEEARYCIECGADLAPAATGPTTRLPEAACPACGSATVPGAEFCAVCGATLAVRPAPPAPDPAWVAPSTPPAQPSRPAAGGAQHLIAPLLLIVTALAFLLMPKLGPFILVAAGFAGLLLRWALGPTPSSSALRGALGALGALGIGLLFFTRRVPWPLLVGALVALSMLAGRRRRHRCWW